MAISFKSVGTYVSGTANLTPVIPTAASGDLMLCAYGTKPFSDVPTINNGWVEIGSAADGTVAAGVDVGSMRTSIFYKIHTGTESDPTITNATNNVSGAVIIVFQKGASENWLTPVGSGGGDASAGTGFSVTAASDVGHTAGDMVVGYAAIRSDAGTQSSISVSIAGTSLDTFTESPSGDLVTAAGGDMFMSGGYAQVLSGTSTAPPIYTSTLAASHTGSAYLVRLRLSAGSPSSSVSPSVSPSSSESSSTSPSPSPSVSPSSSVSPSESPSESPSVSPSSSISSSVSLSISPSSSTSSSTSPSASESPSVSPSISPSASDSPSISPSSSLSPSASDSLSVSPSASISPSSSESASLSPSASPSATPSSSPSPSDSPSQSPSSSESSSVSSSQSSSQSPSLSPSSSTSASLSPSASVSSSESASVSPSGSVSPSVSSSESRSVSPSVSPSSSMSASISSSPSSSISPSNAPQEEVFVAFFRLM